MPTDTPLGNARCSDAEKRGERDLAGAQLGVEDRHLERGLRHRVAMQLGECRRHICGFEPVERAVGAGGGGS